MNSPQHQEKDEIRGISASSSLPKRDKQQKRNVSTSGSTGLSKSLLKSAPSIDGVIHAPPDNTEDNNTGNVPTHIPVVEETGPNSDNNHNSNKIANNINNTIDMTKGDEKRKMENNSNDNNDNSNDKSFDPDPEDDNISDESEYEYEDDDDAAFSGFLMTNNGFGTISAGNSINGNNTNAVPSSSTAPARIVDEDTGTFAVSVSSSATASASASRSSTTTTKLSSATSFSVEDEETEAPSRKKWREPSRAAVNMSIRAQQETSGSKRRLAQDLYRIMNQDTDEAGFSLAPQSEDSMEKWTIKLFQFDPDSNLAKDMMVLGIDNIELEMKFPEQYPFEPPFVRVVRPRFKRQTGFVMNGALCMELLTKDGWNPINDIESVIVSIRSLLVVGDGRLQAATEMTKARYETLLSSAQQQKTKATGTAVNNNNQHEDDEVFEPETKKARIEDIEKATQVSKSQIGSYTATEAEAAYSHLSDYHKKKGWDTSGWWARKG